VSGVRAVKRPTHWSWSALDCHEQCPRRWRHKYIDKLPEPKSAPLIRGSRVHDALEIAVTTTDAVAEEAAPWLNNRVDVYRSWGVEAEVSIFVDRNWDRVPADPDRFIPVGCYTMAKLDIFSEKDGFFGDWKTGKIYPEKHVAQGELYALVLASVTGRKTWDFDAIYVDQGETVPYQFDFDDIGAAQRRWDKRAAPLFEDTVWPKKPSRLCGWCPFFQKNGGPCDGKQDR